MNALAVQQRTDFGKKVNANTKVKVDATQVNAEQLEQVIAGEDLVDRKQMKKNQRVAQARERREQWTHQIMQNPEFAEEFRKTACIQNKDHVDFHIFREPHTVTGELGVIVRTFETSKARADRVQNLIKTQLAQQPPFDEKRQVKGNFMRPVQKTEHKQLAVKHKHFDETARVTAQIEKTGRDYLPENFNLALAKFPVWKTVQKNKWISETGFDLFSGHPHNHVSYNHPGQAKETNHQGSITNKMPWSQIKNEEEAGDNPYAFGYKEQAKNLVTRNRKQEKEVGQHIFSNTVRPVALIEDKVKINSLHSMEGLNRVYLMNTQRSPEKLVFNQTALRSPSVKKETRSDHIDLTRDNGDVIDLLKFKDRDANNSFHEFANDDISNKSVDGNENFGAIGVIQEEQEVPEPTDREFLRQKQVASKQKETMQRMTTQYSQHSRNSNLKVKEIPIVTNEAEKTPLYQTRYRQDQAESDTTSAVNAASLYEKWRVNPHISVRSKNTPNNSLRQTFNHNYSEQVKPVTDNLLAQRMFEGKTYYTDLKEKIVQIPIRPDYHACKLDADTYRNICSPVSTARSTMGKTKYNISMYTKTENPRSSAVQSPLAMSVYHKNATNEKAYTYLKRTRDDDVKLNTHELVTQYFQDEDIAPNTASSARYQVDNRSNFAKTSHGVRQTKKMGVDQKHQQSFKSVM